MIVTTLNLILSNAVWALRFWLKILTPSNQSFKRIHFWGKIVVVILKYELKTIIIEVRSTHARSVDPRTRHWTASVKNMRKTAKQTTSKCIKMLFCTDSGRKNRTRLCLFWICFCIFYLFMLGSNVNIIILNNYICNETLIDSRNEEFYRTKKTKWKTDT